MKMKNHEWVDGKLLQTNKKYSHLKQKQKERLKSKPHSCKFKALLYEHGTHFAFPESMLKIMLPAGGSLLVGAAFRRAENIRRNAGKPDGILTGN